MRESITPNERLAATLRFLATGMNYEQLKFPTLISPQRLGVIIPETCIAILMCLKDYMKMPESQSEWKCIAQGFENRWNFPHCLGAVDGKHVRITPPPRSGSYFWNYKQFNSIVLVACANSNYEFIWCEVGTNGRISDGGAIKNTIFYEKLVSGGLNIPPPETVGGSMFELPYVFVGDEAFALRPDFMKPYAQKLLNTEKRIFNYRLSRTRRIVENAFGILANRNPYLFIDRLKHFVKYAKPSTEDPVLLIADNHTSHCSLPAVLFCREIHITFLTLPPHASHVLQQLDKCYFAPLKALYSSETEKWRVQNPGKVITLYKVSGIFQNAYSATSRVQLAEKGHRVTGIEPNNFDIISEDCYFPSLVTLAPLDNDCTVAVAPEENEGSPSTSRIDVSIQLILPLPRHEQ
ncbi:hypothetical protein AVEN_46589-1 [Araneus ventricosus]|uniref:DDE Tnp4 domain-containing protein n=1 Tax=Araneus ventricosus TaxID=182803 RepID=A0A4Y2ML31_ARAVE|nr:hypothetical protein AVEN_46589-1 [Araneus ventricosus]